MPSVRSIPKEYEIDYLVHQVSGGRPSENDYVWDNYNYYDCLLSLMMMRYDNYVQDASMKAMSHG